MSDQETAPAKEDPPSTCPNCGGKLFVWLRVASFGKTTETVYYVCDSCRVVLVTEN